MEYKEKVIGLLKSTELTEKQKSKLEEVFPELKESEDEEIRKGIIRCVKGNMPDNDFRKKYIAWLEKQGEKVKYHDICDKCARQPTCQSDCFLQQGKQMPAENKGMNLVEEEMTPFQKKVFCIIDTTIEEEQGLKQVCDELLRLAHDEIMQTPAAWTEEDVLILDDTIYFIKEYQRSNRCKDENGMQNSVTCEKWLKSLKDRVQLQPKQEWKQENTGVPKQEWSEEDETYLDHIITAIKSYYTDDKGKENPWREELLRWLKSLRPQSQWKPSDEQMDALRYVTNFDYGGYKATLVSLYEKLKKLRGE